tara:strand:- start:122 stop:307 length:186 start_codon:yes stop_codon:yes gene_type:complete
MKIDKNGIDEIKNTIETPLIGLANKLDKKGQLTKDVSEIVTFIMNNIQKIDSPKSQWEIIN